MGLIILILWYLVEFLAIRNVVSIPVGLFYGTRFGSWLMLGPLTFFYTLSVTDQAWRFQRKNALHFLPFVLFGLLIPLLSGDSLGARQIDYGMLSVFDFRKKVVTPFEYLYAVVFFLQFCHLLAYLIINLRLIKAYKHSLKQQYAALPHVKWLTLFNGLMMGVLVLASIYLYILFEGRIYKRVLDYIYVIPMGFLIYAISYKLSGIAWQPVALPASKYESSSLQPTEIAQIAANLTVLMETEKPYLTNDLRIKDLSEQLTLPSHQLSQVLNQHFGKSFFDYVNSYRVEEAKRLIAVHPEYTLLHLAFEAGFNNKTSFVNAFKKFEGKTPSAFRKGI